MEPERWQYLIYRFREKDLTIPEIDEFHQALEVLRLEALETHDAGQILALSFGQGMLNSMRITLGRKEKT